MIRETVERPAGLSMFVRYPAMATAFDIFSRALAKTANTHGVLGEEQVIFPPDPAYGYHCTPANALTFGSMGVDGVHYAILTIDGTVRDDSPVLHVSPMDGDCYHVLAPTFLDYLAAGCGVTRAEMQELLNREEHGEQVLLPFLRQRFDQGKLLQTDADWHRFAHLLSIVQAPPVEVEHKVPNLKEARKSQDELDRIAEADARITGARCPHCGKPCPSYRQTCKHCRKPVHTA